MEGLAVQASSDKPLACLCTSVGIDAFAAIHGALKAFYGETMTLVGCDVRADAYGLYLADKGYLVPKLTTPELTEKLLDIVRQERCCVIYPLSSADQEYFGTRRGFFEDQGVRVIVSDPDAVSTANDKARLYERCKKAGLPAAAYVLLDDPSSLDSALRALGYPERPAVFKPVRGSGGKGLAVIREGTSIFDSLYQTNGPPQMSAQEFSHTLARKQSGQGVLCEYLPGDEYSVDVLSWRGKALVSVVRKRYASLGGTAWHAEVVDDEELCRLAEAVVRELGLSYTSNVQFRRNAHGVPCVMEVNPRTPGTIGLTVRAGANMPALAVELALGRQIPERFSIQYGMRIMRYFGGYYHSNTLLRS